MARYLIGNVTGPQGPAGADGISPEASIEQTQDGAVITITDKDGTTTAILHHGESRSDYDIAKKNGYTGTESEWLASLQGVSPTAVVVQNGPNATITITDKNGTTSATVNSGGTFTAGNGIDITNGVISVTEMPDLSDYATLSVVNDLVGATQTMVTSLSEGLDENGVLDITLDDISEWNSKQDTLTAGTGIAITNNEISIDSSNVTSKLYVDTELAKKQDVLTAGNNVSISRNQSTGNLEISASLADITEEDPVFTASPAANITVEDIAHWNTAVEDTFSGDYEDLTNKPDLSVYATNAALGTGLSGKQDVLTAGTGISIDNGVISATGSGGITTETDPVFSASPAASITSSDIAEWDAKSDFSGDYNDLTNKPDLSVYATNTALGNGLSRKQDILTAGDGIEIDNDTIHVLVDGTTIDFDEDNQLTIGSDIPDKSYVDRGLSGKQDTLTAGTNITIENNVISAAGGSSFTPVSNELVSWDGNAASSVLGLSYGPNTITYFDEERTDTSIKNNIIEVTSDSPEITTHLDNTLFALVNINNNLGQAMSYYFSIRGTNLLSETFTATGSSVTLQIEEGRNDDSYVFSISGITMENNPENVITSIELAYNGPEQYLGSLDENVIPHAYLNPVGFGLSPDDTETTGVPYTYIADDNVTTSSGFELNSNDETYEPSYSALGSDGLLFSNNDGDGTENEVRLYADGDALMVDVNGTPDQVAMLSDISGGGGSSLPTISAGDAGKVLTVNSTEDGIEWAAVSGGGSSGGSSVYYYANGTDKTNWNSQQELKDAFNNAITQLTDSGNLPMFGIRLADGRLYNLINYNGPSYGTYTFYFRDDMNLRNLYVSWAQSGLQFANVRLNAVDAYTKSEIDTNFYAKSTIDANFAPKSMVPTAPANPATALYLNDANNITYQITVGTDGTLSVTVV